MNLKHFLSGYSLAAILFCLPGFSYAQENKLSAQALQPRAEVSVKGGTDRSLLTTEFWAPLAQERDRVMYGDIRLMGDNDENREGNLGVGYRQIVEDYVLGGHAWIDRRRTTNNSTFHQVTFGVERLGHIVDMRANGYIPLNNSHRIVTPNGSNTTPYLAGSGIFYDTNGVVTETPQYGMDAEIGYRFPIFPKHIDTFRVYGGGYHFFRNDTDNVTGFRIRTEAQVNKAISIGARFQHDGPRGSQGFLEAILKFPFSAKKLYHEDYIRSRLDESPERDVDIVTDTKKQAPQTKVPVINTVTGQQQRVLYVDNTASSSGNGTKENPFNTLAAAQAALQANDVLYVNRGDGTSTGMDQGIVIDKANISLIGSGSNFVYDSGKFTAQNGIDFTGTLLQVATAAPVITNTQTFADDYTGNGILILSNDASISGISVQNANARGIFALAEPGKNLGTVYISNVLTSGNGQDGIRVEADGINARIENAVILNSTSNSNRYGVVYVTDHEGIIARGNYHASETSTNTLDGLRIETTRSGEIKNIFSTNITTSNNGRNGVWVLASQSANSENITINNAMVSGNASAGIAVTQTTATANDIVLSNNIIKNNLINGITVSTVTAAQLGTIDINNNLIDHNTGTGLYIEALTLAHIDNIQMNNNVLDGNTVYNSWIKADDAGIQNIDVTSLVTKNAIGAGLYLLSTNNGLIGSINLSDISVYDGTSHGINVQATAGGKVNDIVMQNIEAHDNNLTGVRITATGTNSAIVNGTYKNITSNNNQYGLYMDVVTGGNLNNVTISDVIINNSDQDGMLVQVSGTLALMGQANISNVFSNGNGREGLAVTVGAGGTARFEHANLSNITTTNNVGSGIKVGLSTGTMVQVTMDGISTSGNARGIYFDGTASASGNLTKADVTNVVATANGYGFRVDTIGKINAMNISNVTANNNTSIGIAFNKTSAGGVIDNIKISESDFVDNGNAGVLLNKGAAGTFVVDLGGGSLGSIGQNRIFNNVLRDIQITNYAVSAQSNWWGVSTGLNPSRVTTASGGSVAAGTFLTVDPRP